MSRPKLLADHDLNEHIIVGVLRLICSASEAEEWENQVCFLPFE